MVPSGPGAGDCMDEIGGRSGGGGKAEEGNKSKCSHLPGCHGLVEGTVGPEGETGMNWKGLFLGAP